MKCGFVILNYNDYQETIQLINCISKYDSINHIVVVDNRSPNGSFDILKKFNSSKVSIIQTPFNDGYSSGNNFGVRYLLQNYHVDVVAISNPDVEFEESFVVKLLDDLEKNPKMAIVTGLQYSPKGGLAIHAFWPNYSVWQYFSFKAFSLRSIYHLKKVSSDYNYAQRKIKENSALFEVGSVEGSLFFIKSQVFVDVGLFDENVAFYHEEDILSKKISNLGKIICVDPSVRYTHYGAQTTGKTFTNSIKAKHSFNSSIYYFNNYLSKNIILQILNYILCMTIRIEDFVVWKIKNIIGCGKRK